MRLIIVLTKFDTSREMLRKKSQKILITGGKGFIGSNLAKALTLEGHRVKSFDVMDKENILNQEQIETAVQDMDSVFHLAAIADLSHVREHPKTSVEQNVQGTLNVLEACRKHHAHLFLASTCAVYGNHHELTTEDSPTTPAELYGQSKLAAESLIRGYVQMYQLQANIMRFGTVYGPGMKPACGMHIFFRQALLGEPITVHGDGGQTRNLTFIDDLIEGILLLFESDEFGQTLNFSAEEEVSALAVAQEIKKITGSESPILHVPQRPGQTMRERISSKKAFEVLGWEATTRFEEGLKKTYEWFRDIPFPSLRQKRSQDVLSRTPSFRSI